MKKYYTLFFVLIIITLLYTRFINLGWGLPYPFHPDERNMADAVTRLSCLNWSTECFNPHFFAYGQLPLYIVYIGIFLFHVFTHTPFKVDFVESVIALRVLSAFASIGTFIFMLKIIEIFSDGHEMIKEHKNKEKRFLVLSSLVFIFSPVLIQFAHFGTTESMLMLFYTILVYLALKVITSTMSFIKYIFLSGIISGFAMATKVSSYSFLLVPVIIIIQSFKKVQFTKKITHTVTSLALFSIITLIFTVILSPHNIISHQEFLGSIQYESSVGFGELKVFYTRQFQMVLPVIFQFSSIFPYALGHIATILFILGFIFLPKKREYNVLRMAFLIVFLLNAFVYTKWSRFMAPTFPIMLIMAVLVVKQLTEIIINRFRHLSKLNKRLLHYALLSGFAFILSVPGIAYLSVYQNQDVRFSASEWIYKSIPANSVILSETANVVDLPILPPTYMEKNRNVPFYDVISFNSYDVDIDPLLQVELKNSIAKADYIIIPSRRVFGNHTCIQNTINNVLLKNIRCRYLEARYPVLNAYYDNLFSGKLGFELVKEFDAAPKISLFGKFLYSIPDEEAEETWSVFDHPKIRIYKRKTK